MLDTFRIDNFRLFRHLEVARLGRVNLLVGKNNSGKSAFLEALAIYASNASLLMLRDLMAVREETWNERNQPDIGRVGDVGIRHLFRGHELPKIGYPGIFFGPIQDSSKWLELSTAAFQVVPGDDGILRRRMLTTDEVANAQGDEEFELALVALEPGKSRRIIRLDQTSDLLRQSRLVSNGEPNYPFQFVPTRNMTAERIAALWDMIGLTPLAEEIIAGLRLIEPQIKGVLFVQNVNVREARIPLVSVNNSPEPLPLKSMGDGLTRLFHIIVALVSAREGIVMIDEFENGLHWSVQLAVWKTIFRLSAHLNVQVFATTHSRDCIASFEQAWAEDCAAGAFFRLQLDADGVPAIKPYSLETLADSLETEVEVR